MKLCIYSIFFFLMFLTICLAKNENTKGEEKMNARSNVTIEVLPPENFRYEPERLQRYIDYIILNKPWDMEA
ncbi:conserved Plasmodium protein, unknown function [Plasmodium ovale]|uniref:Fam-a protein n=1 Tax=Plasmodium ovale TaxID=36330 RepID=A0A1D3KY98_PLAOA|nr:conserved Plasmodium protein, unknown function [Plasmodium ovale]